MKFWQRRWSRNNLVDSRNSESTLLRGTLRNIPNNSPIRARVYLLKNNLQKRYGTRAFSIIFFPEFARAKCAIIENHCNPISLPGGRRDVKSRKSRLRSCHPKWAGEIPIPTNKMAPRRTCNNRIATRFGTLHPPGQTAPAPYTPKSAYCFFTGSHV